MRLRECACVFSYVLGSQKRSLNAEILPLILYSDQFMVLTGSGAVMLIWDKAEFIVPIFPECVLQGLWVSRS